METVEDEGGRSRVVRWIVHGLLAGGGLALLWWVGHHVADEVQVLERHIESLGLWGTVVFVLLMLVLTSVFVPESLMSMVAGFAYGPVWGTLLAFVAVALTAIANFHMASRLLQRPIARVLEGSPKLKAIQSAANRQGFRLMLLLRLTPLSPVMVSYALGAGGARFTPFVLATIGLLPALAMEAYFGHTAKHLTQVSVNPQAHSMLHTLMTIGGLAICAIVTFYLSRVATKALAEAEATSESEGSETSPSPPTT